MFRLDNERNVQEEALKEVEKCKNTVSDYKTEISGVSFLSYNVY